MRVCCGDTEEIGCCHSTLVVAQCRTPRHRPDPSQAPVHCGLQLVTEEMVASTLTVQPVATDTKEFYEYLGWQRVGTTKAPAGAVSPFFDVYLLPLHTTP